MTTLILVSALLTVNSIPQHECVGDASSPALDHVVLVVRDLDQAGAEFQKYGFRLKQGRLHDNNLVNRHIKFRDGSSIELMTVQGDPGDSMAQDYVDLLAAGEGGVYVALSAPNIAVPQGSASALQLEIRQSTSGPWRFVSFPPTSPAAAVFFATGATTKQDADSLTSHRPDVVGLDEAWLQGGSQLGELLVQVGAKRCGPARSPVGHVGQRYGLSRGTVAITPASTASRPRVLGAVLRSPTSGERTIHPHPQFWVHYTAEAN